MRLIPLIIITSFLAIAAAAQDLTGTWEGSGGQLDYARLCIIRVNDTYIGYTYDEGMGFCRANFIGTYNIANKKLRGINDGMINKSAFHAQSRYNLKYVAADGKEYLKGTASAKQIGAKLMSFGLPITLIYTRVSAHIDTTAYMLARLAALQPAGIAIADTLIKQDPLGDPDSIITQKNKRITDTLSVINTNEKELLVKVMDNGVVDGDIVSIIHNGKVIAERISVTETPFEIRIANDRQNSLQEIILVAHNTGSIAPNTALILIETPSRQYRLTASTDLSKNAMIIFRYNE